MTILAAASSRPARLEYPVSTGRAGSEHWESGLRYACLRLCSRADGGNQNVDVVARRARVDDTGAQPETSVEKRAGEERLSAELHPLECRPVDFVESHAVANRAGAPLERRFGRTIECVLAIAFYVDGTDHRRRVARDARDDDLGVRIG